MLVREDGRERRISKQRALIKTQVARALKGNDRAAAKVLDVKSRPTVTPPLGPTSALISLGKTGMWWGHVSRDK